MQEMKFLLTTQNPSICVGKIQLVYLKMPKLALHLKLILNPIVNHQIIKNGFNALSAIPVINGPCFGIDVISLLFCNTFFNLNKCKNKKCNCSNNGNYCSKFWK